MCVFCCCKICTEGNSDTLMVLKRRPSISVLSTCDNASKSWEFYIWLRKFPELLHFLKPAVQLDGCSAEELVRRPLHCVRVVFCKRRNLILQHFESPSTISHLMNPIASFWQKVWRGIYNIYRLFISTLYSWKASVLPSQQDIYFALMRSSVLLTMSVCLCTMAC